MIVPIAVSRENKQKIEINVIIKGEKMNFFYSDSSEELLYKTFISSHPAPFA